MNRLKLEQVIFYGNRKQDRIDAFEEYKTWNPQTKREKAEKEIFIGMALMNRRELNEFY